MKIILIVILVVLTSTIAFAQEKPAGPSGCLRAEVTEYQAWIDELEVLFEAFLADTGYRQDAAWDAFINSIRDHQEFLNSGCGMIREGYLEFLAWYGLQGASILLQEGRGSIYEQLMVDELFFQLMEALDWNILSDSGYNPA